MTIAESMNKKNALILLLAISAIYIYFIWIAKIFGPGGSLFFSVIFLILFIYLVSSLVKKKKK